MLPVACTTRLEIVAWSCGLWTVEGKDLTGRHTFLRTFRAAADLLAYLQV